MIKNKDFMILLIARFITNFGDSLYSIATMSLVYAMTGSSFYTGLALFLTSSMAIFQVLLSPILDRINLKKFLCLSQLIQGLLLLIIAILQHYNRLSLYHILIFMPIVSLLNQLVYPAELSLLPRILDKNDLVKANSLFSLAYQGSDAIFNALSGFLIAIFGFAFAYYIDSITFIINAVLFIFLSRIISNKLIEDSNKTIKNHFASLKNGLKLWNNKVLKALLIGVVLINFSSTMILAILPEFSNNQTFYGILLSATGFGVLIGSLMANLNFIRKRNLGALYISFITLSAILWMAMTLNDLSLAQGKIIAFSLFLLGWVLIGILNIYSQTIVQMMVPIEQIGVALSSMIGVSVALAPFGAISASILSRYYDSKKIILFASFLILISALYWVFNKNIRNMKSLEEVGSSTGLDELK